MTFEGRYRAVTTFKRRRSPDTGLRIGCEMHRRSCGHGPPEGKECKEKEKWEKGKMGGRVMPPGLPTYSCRKGTRRLFWAAPQSAGCCDGRNGILLVGDEW